MWSKVLELSVEEYELQVDMLDSSSGSEARKALFVTELEYCVDNKAFRRDNPKDCFSL
jgi:hypothetical protein